jgi:long-chain fatty acid transport protein
VLPDIASVSLTQRVNPRWTLYAEFQWTDWSRFKTLSAYRNDRTLITSQRQNYRNSFLIAIGASYQVNENLTIRAGLGFDKTPITDAYRTVRVPDQNRLILAAGLTYRLMPNTAIDLGYAHMFMRNASIREASAASDILAGSTSSALDVIALGTRFAF